MTETDQPSLIMLLFKAFAFVYIAALVVLTIGAVAFVIGVFLTLL